MFGRVVKLEPLDDAPRSGGRKGLVMGDSGGRLAQSLVAVYWAARLQARL